MKKMMTNDILEQEHSARTMLPLAPIGGASKALPPLKKLAPLGSIDKAAGGGIDLKPLGSISSKPLEKEIKSSQMNYESPKKASTNQNTAFLSRDSLLTNHSPQKASRPLKLGMGKSFLKTDSMESLDHNSDQASVRSSGIRPIRAQYLVGGPIRAQYFIIFFRLPERNPA